MDLSVVNDSFDSVRIPIPGRARRPVWWGVVLLSLAGATAWYGGRASAQSAPARETAAPATTARTSCARTVIVVRHAEKDASGDPRDPHLDAKGTARAAALAKLLQPAGVTHVYATEFRRTQETVAPLAARIGHEAEIVPAARTDALVEKLRALPPGSVAVVAAHSNTVLAIVERLGGNVARVEKKDGTAMLADAEYGRMFVVTMCAASPECSDAVATCELAYGD